MNVDNQVPFSLDEVTPEWLTYALRSSGHLPTGTVEQLNVRTIGEDAGFLGQIAILTPEYSSHAAGPAGAQPLASMVIKIPTPGRSRLFGHVMGVYEREIRFYADLKDQLGINAPACYYSAVSAADEPPVIAQRLAKFGRYPLWAMPLIGAIALARFALQRPRRYVLLIEDISHLRLGDQSIGCSLEDMKKVLREMARFQAPYWGSPTHQHELPWIGTLYDSSKLLQLWFLGSLGRYRKATRGALSERQIKLVDWVHRNGVRLSRELGEHPRTLAHHDQRLDNIAFDDATGRALIFDWQTVTFCSAGLELAYFMSSAQAGTLSEAQIDELLLFYQEQLAAGGATVSTAYLRWIYEVGMLTMLHRMISVLYQGQIELGSGRGPRVMQRWIEVVYQRLEAVQFEDILERRPTP